MGLFMKVLHRGVCDFPIRGAKFVIEDNIGDKYPIHIHMGDVTGIYNNGNQPADMGIRGSCPFYNNLPNIRLHFTYEEFKELYEGMKKIGRL